MKRSVPRRALRAIAFVALNLAVLELAARAFFAFQVGPRLLFYGTRWHRNVQAAVQAPAPDPSPWDDSVQGHHNDIGDYRPYHAGTAGYSKYFPNETKWTESPDRKERWPARINNQGFRGADFEIEKAPGTIRILTLGASSTFGYHDRDDETYPALLERDLQHTAPPGVRYEVISFAIPHAGTDNILAMFQAEGLRLHPDFVTFYEGANDSVMVGQADARAGDGWYDVMVGHSVLWALGDRLVPRTKASNAAWLWSDDVARSRARDFVANLDRLAELCRKNGAELIVATQQLQSNLVPPEQLDHVTYDEEVALVRARLAAGAIGPGYNGHPDVAFKLRLTADDPMLAAAFSAFDGPRVLLIHSRMMDAEREWAARKGIRLVDVIRALDGHRSLMVNWVHLCGEGNVIVARALAGAILDAAAGKRVLSERGDDDARIAGKPRS